MKTDIEIAQEAKMKPITQIAAQLGLEDESVIPYGRYKAKIDHRLIHNAKKQGKLILVTAISPTPAGEGKTTTSVGLADAMNALGKKTMLCLREPSLGPVFGIKGGELIRRYFLFLDRFVIQRELPGRKETVIYLTIATVARARLWSIIGSPFPHLRFSRERSFPWTCNPYRLF